MAIDLAALRPKINPAPLCTGAGSTPVTTATPTWNWLPAKLNEAVDRLLGRDVPRVAAQVGNATSVGKLSVPPSWPVRVPPSTETTAIPISNFKADRGAEIVDLLSRMPLAGRGIGGFSARSRRRHNPTLVPSPPAAG